MNLSNVATTELIEELKKRKGVETSSTGVFREYELIPKYKKTQHERKPIQAELILIVKDLVDIIE